MFPSEPDPKGSEYGLFHLRFVSKTQRLAPSYVQYADQTRMADPEFWTEDELRRWLNNVSTRRDKLSSK